MVFVFFWRGGGIRLAPATCPQFMALTRPSRGPEARKPLAPLVPWPCSGSPELCSRFPQQHMCKEGLYEPCTATCDLTKERGRDVPVLRGNHDTARLCPLARTHVSPHPPCSTSLSCGPQRARTGPRTQPTFPNSGVPNRGAGPAAVGGGAHALSSRGTHRRQPTALAASPPHTPRARGGGAACCCLSFTKTPCKMDVRKAPTPHSPQPPHPSTSDHLRVETRASQPRSAHRPHRGPAERSRRASARQHGPRHDAVVNANRSQDPQRRQGREPPRARPGRRCRQRGPSPHAQPRRVSHRPRTRPSPGGRRLGGRWTFP